MKGFAGHIDDQLAAYTAGELSAVERVAVERHLEECAACREALAEAQRIRALLASLAVSAAVQPSLADDVLRGIAHSSLDEALASDLVPSAPAELDAPASLADSSWLRPLLPDDRVLPSDTAASPPRRGAGGVGGREWKTVHLDTALDADGEGITMTRDERQTRQSSSTDVLDRAGPPADGLSSEATHTSPSPTSPSPTSPSPTSPSPTSRRWRAPMMLATLGKGGKTRPYAALAATLLIVALGALLFSQLSRGQHGGTTSLQPTATVKPAATPVPTTMALDPKTGLPVNGSLAGVQMLSSTDGWAIGSVGTRLVGDQALILHYNGTRWSTVGDTFANVSLSSISMTAPDDGWAVGVTGKGSSETGSIMLHYSGGRWSSVALPSMPASALLSKVRMFSASEGWAIAYINGTAATILLRYHDGAWSEVPNSLSLVLDLSMTSPDDGWFVGANGTLAHYQSGQFTQWTGSVPGALQSVRMLSPSEGWIIGTAAACNCSDSSVPFAMHYDGRTWTKMPIATTDSDSLPQEMTMVSSSEGWAVGQTQVDAYPPFVTLILHYSHGRWQETNVRLPIQLNSISMVSANEGWAVGSTYSVTAGAGTPVDYSKVTTPPALVHYQNGTWRAYTG